MSRNLRGRARRDWSLLVAVAAITVVACSQDDPPVADGHRGLPFESMADVVTNGDFAATFTVVDEHEFGGADIDRPADASPMTVPPVREDDDYVGRVVTVNVDSVLWHSGRGEIPQAFDFVTLGWDVANGDRELADDSSWFRPAVDHRYFGVFAVSGGDVGPMSMDAVYELDGTTLIQAGPVSGPPGFAGAELSEVGQLLANAEPS